MKNIIFVIVILFILGCSVKDVLPATMSYVDQAAQRVTKNLQALRDDVQENLGETKNTLRNLAGSVHEINLDLHRMATRGNKKRLASIRLKRVMRTGQIKADAIREAKKTLNEVPDDDPPGLDWLDRLFQMIMDNLGFSTTGLGGVLALAMSMRKNAKHNKRHEERDEEVKTLRRQRRELALEKDLEKAKLKLFEYEQ